MINEWICVENKLPPLNTRVWVYYYESSGKSDKPLIEGKEVGELVAEDSKSGWPVWAFKTGVLGGGEVKKWKKL